MLLLTVATYQLVVWNRNYDPRFYHFLSTAPGRTLSRLMNWSTFYNQPPYDKPEREFTAEELSWKRKIEARLKDSWPSHRLVTRQGEEHLVRILRQSESMLRFEQSFGGGGRLSRDIERSEIAILEPYEIPPPRVSWRDVRFQMEFPTFQLIHLGHYAVVTDAPYFQVIDSVRTLEALYADYMVLFGDLRQTDRPAHGLQVLLFSQEEAYRQHQNLSAPGLENSAGFYAPLQDRMVVFNQYHSSHSRQMREEIEAEIQRIFLEAGTAAERRSIQEMRSRVEEQMRERGRRETTATLRHEGAHHLSYTFGVHSWHHSENGWLIEGLAVYFESSPPGEVPEGHRGTLFQLLTNRTLPSLHDIMAVRKPEDFEAALPGYAAYEIYALSWGMFHYAMQAENRDAFMDYLQFVRNPENIRELLNMPADALLARFLGKTTPELERGWISHMHALMGL